MVGQWVSQGGLAGRGRDQKSHMALSWHRIQSKQEAHRQERSVHEPLFWAQFPIDHPGQARMDLVPLGLAGPLVAPTQPSGGAKRKRQNALPQTFLVVSVPSAAGGEVVTHGLYTLSEVGAYSRNASDHERAQLEALKLDPACAVVWKIARASTVKLDRPLDPSVHCPNLGRLLVAKLTPRGRSDILANIEPDKLDCPASKIRCWRLHRHALAPSPGMGTLVSSSTQCRAVGIEKPEQELPEVQALALPAPAPPPGRQGSQLELACNTSSLARGFCEVQFRPHVIFLAVKLMAKMRTHLPHNVFISYTCIMQAP
jgi:hypothetical protein